MDALFDLVVPPEFMPHGHCYQWRPALVFLHAGSDSVVFLAYMAIPVVLWIIASRRGDLPFRGLFLAFVLFILCCGFTHLAAVWTLWQPGYWVSGGIKGVTAVVSMATGVMLMLNVKNILAIPRADAVRRAHAQISDSEALFRAAADAMLDGFSLLVAVRDEKGTLIDFRVQHINEPAVKMAGRTVAQALGNSLVEVFEMTDRIWQDYAEVVDKQSPIERRFCVPTPEGDRWYRHQVVPAQADSIVVITREITAEQNAAIATERLAKLVEAIDDGVVALDSDRRIQAWNPGAVRLFGLDASVVTGHTAVELGIVADQIIVDAVTSAVGGESAAAEGDLQRTNGERVPVAIRANPVRLDESDAGGAVLVLRDLTESRQKMQLEEALQAKALLIREIHHRVKNNLQLMSSVLRMAARSVRRGNMQPVEAFADTQARLRAIALVHQHLYREDAGSRIDLAEYVHTLANEIIRAIGHKEVELRLDTRPSQAPLERAIPVALILNELISNALEHGVGSGPGVIAVELRERGDHFVLRVEDSGEPFPTEDPDAGSLGWTLVDSLVAQLSGTWERTDEPKGVVVRIPRGWE